MTSDGGGWTAVFAGRNGSPNVFDHFDIGSYTGTTTDPATRYLRRAPAAFGGAPELAVSCGAAMVSFALTEPVRAWLISGTQGGWATLSQPRVLRGTVANVPNGLWTGSTGSASFIFARNQGGGGNTFAASYANGTGFDYCNGVFDQATLVRVFYREAVPTSPPMIPDANRNGVTDAIDALCILRLLGSFTATANCPVPFPFGDVMA